MDKSGMFLNALSYVAFIILSGIVLLTCLVLFIVRISQNHKHRWNWLAATIGSLLLLLFSIFVFTRKVVSTVKNIGETVESKLEESFEELKLLDSSYAYVKLDSCEMVKKLREFENINGINAAPKEFYVYYGFNDYYRMPLAYPFSLHSTDILETGSLFNEKNVTEFNVNDNGEIECDLENITSFAFDQNVLITEVKQPGKKTNTIYFIYEFSTDKKTKCKSLAEAKKVARKQFNYRGYDTLIKVIEYKKLFD